jgi:hypothetical protein
MIVHPEEMENIIIYTGSEVKTDSDKEGNVVII